MVSRKFQNNYDFVLAENQTLYCDICVTEFETRKR